jgi:hypothetical protein
MNNDFDKHDSLNHEWVSQARTLLDQSTQELDAATLSRLNRVRQAALAQARPRAAQRWVLPAGLASACVLLLAVAAWHSSLHGGAAPTPALPLTVAASSNSGDIDLVSSDDSLELYQNLEFYAWLDAQDQDFGG